MYDAPYQPDEDVRLQSRVLALRGVPRQETIREVVGSASHGIEPEVVFELVP